MKNQMKQYFKVLYLLIVIMGIMVACKTKKPIVTQPIVPDIKKNMWRCKIYATDIAEFPLVKLKAIVLDEKDQKVLNLAPPYGHHNDWDSIWKPLIAEHPQWGKKELIDFKIREIQNIDSVAYFKKVQKRDEQLRKLQIEKDNILAQIQAETRLNEIEKMVEERKSNRSQKEIEETRQTSVVLLLDISGSMWGDPLVKAKRAISEFLKFSDAEIAIVAFNDRFHPILNFSLNKDSLIQSFLSLEASGGTMFYDALYAALDLFKDRKGKKHIVAISDGLTGGDSHSMADVIQKALNMNVGIDAKTGDAVKIFTIGFGRENDDLIKLSKETNGKSYYAYSDINLLEAFSDYMVLKLEFTIPDITLLIQLEEINKKMDKIEISVIEEFCYEISFELPFIIEDGLEQIVTFKFGDTTLIHPVLAPVSTKEFMLHGYITDKTTGDSIPGAIIVVNPEGSDSSYISKSGPSGRYEMLVEKNDGMYSVIVSADHYFIHTEELPLAKKDKYFIQLNRSLPRIEKGINVSLRTIHFEDNEFLFEPVSFNDLVSLSNYFVKHPEFKIEVAGHTDSYGDDKYNQWLSERRAETVVDYLTSLGFPESNISSKGFGESNLLVPDDSPENRYINRRVKITLVDIWDSK